MSEEVSFWISEVFLLGRLRVAATDRGLCKLALGRESDQAFFSWLWDKMRPSDILCRTTPLIQDALAEINAYLAGELQAFTTPLDSRGTSFQRQVWTQVSRIPYGERISYGRLAANLGHPKAARAVGAANGANPLPLFVPCHRVVGADGALRGYGGGLEIKGSLLRLERALTHL